MRVERRGEDVLAAHTKYYVCLCPYGEKRQGCFLLSTASIFKACDVVWRGVT